MDSQDQGNQNGGVLSKFWQRIFNIKRSRSKKKSNNKEFIQDKVEEIREAIRKDNGLRYRRLRSKGIGEIESKKKRKQELGKDPISQVIVDIRKTFKDRNYRRGYGGVSKLDDSFQDEIVQDKGKGLNFSGNKNVKVRYGYASSADKRNIKVGTDDEKKEFIKKLGAEIIDKLKDSFEDKLDEISVLESELFLLVKSQENELELKKVREIKRKINELVKQVNELIEQYDLYRTSYYIDNITGIDDNVLADDIIQYRDLLDSFSAEKKFVKEYKALEQFQKFYRNLKAVRDEAERLVEENEEKIKKIDIRDKKYNKIKLGVVNVHDINEKCEYEIKRQNDYFASLMEKINDINKEEYITAHLRGVGSLISSSLNYIGLLMLSPLSGLIPSIAIQTMVTRRMIGNIYRNLHVEQVNHVRYNTIDYESELNSHLCDVDYTSVLLSDTLKDVKKLKEDFLLQYNSEIPGYQDTLKNIEKIENKIIHNQNRVEIVKKNLKKSKKINENKKFLVKQMNDNAA